MNNKTKTRDETLLNAHQLRRNRTRQKLLEAARSMATSGQKVSVAEAAKVAGISTATAYRYYNDPQTMLSDAALDLGMGDYMALYRAKVKWVDDPLQRLLIAQAQMLANVASDALGHRMFVAKEHERIIQHQGKPPTGIKTGRRVQMIEAALEPVIARHGLSRIEPLITQLLLVMGPDAYFILTDLRGLSLNALTVANNAAITAIYNGFMAGLPG